MNDKHANVGSMHGAMILGGVALALLVGGLGVWSVTASLSGAIVAPGQIEVEHNRQVVQHPDGGVIAKINISESSPVKAGDVLISLDGTSLATELAIVEGHLFEIVAQRARLEAERDDKDHITMPDFLTQAAQTHPQVQDQIEGQTGLFMARLEGAKKEIEQLRNRIVQINNQIEGIDAQARANDIQLSLIQQELSNQNALLAKGLTQATSVLALQREEARLMGQMGALASSRAEAREKITEINVQIGRIELQRRTEAADTLRSIAPTELELIERRGALNEKINRLDIRAPVSGVVLGLAFTTPRSVIRSAEPVLYIVPQDRPLVISAQVSPIHIDEIHVGQSAELVFSAFSSRTTPHLAGTVNAISADTLSDQQTRSSYYRVELTPNFGELEKLNNLILLPGMPVEAFIQTQSQSPISYLLKPFTDYFSRAFRET